MSKNQPDNPDFAGDLSVVYASLGEKNSALNEAQRGITLVPSSKDRLGGPGFEENLALVEMLIGENSRAISTLTRLLQTPYYGGFVALRPAGAFKARSDLGPFAWRSRFPKTLRGKAAVKLFSRMNRIMRWISDRKGVRFVHFAKIFRRRNGPRNSARRVVLWKTRRLDPFRRTECCEPGSCSTRPADTPDDRWRDNAEQRSVKEQTESVRRQRFWES